MDFVDRDRRIRRLPLAARCHPGFVVPAMMVRLRHDRGGARRRFGLPGQRDRPSTAVCMPPGPTMSYL